MRQSDFSTALSAASRAWPVFSSPSWCNFRGWPKDVQRTVFQPVAVAIFLMSAIWLGAKGTVTAETAKFFVMGLPCVLGGTWLGLKLFGRIDEATFRKIVLALLFLSGVTLLF